MLTLKEINEITFRKSKFSSNGYSTEDVNEFIEQVVETVEALINESKAAKAKTAELVAKNSELREKLQVLARKVESYREDEDGIKSALLSAQKMGSASLKEAKVKSDEILLEANQKADKMVEESKKKATDIIDGYTLKIENKKREYEMVKEEVTDFRAMLFEMYRKHLTSIETIPDFTNEINERKAKEEYANDSSNAVSAQIEDIMPIAESNAQDSYVANTETRREEDEITEIDYSEDSSDEFMEELEEITDDMFTDFEVGSLEVDENMGEDSELSDEDQDLLEQEAFERDAFEEIDFNAYADIPEALIEQKSKAFDDLEFGDDVDVRRR